MAGKGRPKKPNGSNGGANLGFEAKMWLAADELRGQVDAAEYKHVVLGLVFLKYISDAFGEHHAQLVKEHPDEAEDRDAYKAEGVFWVPKEARWSFLQANAKQPTIGKIVDDAMDAIERDNPSLKGVLPKDYARSSLDKVVLGRLIDLVGTIGLGDTENRSKDVLGRVYEYFLGQFASAEGKKGGEFYTPRCVVRLLVEMIEPFKGRVYDPCCGSSGMFVQSEEFIKEHGGKLGDISIYGQESNPTTWKLAKMNLAIRAIEANLGPHNADTFRNDLHKDLKADFILANPPFNMSTWGGEGLRDDLRWKFGIPPSGNANFAWIQHIIHHLAPNGAAGFVMVNVALSSNVGGEHEIRKAIVEADLVDCIVTLPPQLFYGATIAASLWFLTRDKASERFRDRRGQILFIDARKLGHLADRKHRELSDVEISRIARTYHHWRGEGGTGAYEDVGEFCKSATVKEVETRRFDLTPGIYVRNGVNANGRRSFESEANSLVRKLEGVLPRYVPLTMPADGQTESALILGLLDELDRNVDGLVEHIVRALFRSWFVDYEPGRAKAEGRWKRGQSRPGMPPDSWDLWDTEFENTELGLIPKGWRATNLGGSTEAIFSGGTPDTRNPDFWGGEHPWLSSGETRQGYISSTEKHITPLGIENSSTRLAKRGDTVIASAGQGNTRGQVSLCLIDTYVNQSIVVVRPKSGTTDSSFLFYNLSDRYDELRAISDSHSSRGSLTTKTLADLGIVLPPFSLISSFNALAISIVRQVNLLRSARGPSKEAYGLFFSRLLSGEVGLLAD